MGWLLLLVGLSVFAIRLQHAVPAGGTLTSALLSLGLGTDAEAALPAIRVHVSGDEFRMRSVATKLLATVGANSSEAEAEIVAGAGSDDLRTCLEALLAIEKLDPVARQRVPGLLQAMRHPEIQTWQLAGRALASVLEGDPTSVEKELRALLADSNPRLRAGAAARKAVNQIKGLPSPARRLGAY